MPPGWVCEPGTRPEPKAGTPACVERPGLFLPDRPRWHSPSPRRRQTPRRAQNGCQGARGKARPGPGSAGTRPGPPRRRPLPPASLSSAATSRGLRRPVRPSTPRTWRAPGGSTWPPLGQTSPGREPRGGWEPDPSNNDGGGDSHRSAGDIVPAGRSPGVRHIGARERPLPKSSGPGKGRGERLRPAGGGSARAPGRSQGSAPPGPAANHARPCPEQPPAGLWTQGQGQTHPEQRPSAPGATRPRSWGGAGRGSRDRLTSRPEPRVSVYSDPRWTLGRGPLPGGGRRAPSPPAWFQGGAPSLGPASPAVWALGPSRKSHPGWRQRRGHQPRILGVPQEAPAPPVTCSSRAGHRPHWSTPPDAPRPPGTQALCI